MWMKSITWLVRILTGALFVYSGFVKAIDPWGTLYKFEDYMQAMHLPMYPNLLLVAVFILCGYEFCIGAFLLLGCFRRSAPVCAAAFMVVMLPLTLWIAIADPVADCGCFGDAFIISNWATFWKNVVISAAIIWLLKYNTQLKCLIRPHIQWIALLASGCYVVVIGLCGYVYQPLIDFRPYQKGAFLVNEEESEDEDEEEYRLIYEKNGVEESFGIDDELPSEEEGWNFVRRELVSPESSDSLPRKSSNVEYDTSAATKTQESTFRLWSEDGEEDLTEDAILREGEQLILFMPDLKNVSVATTWQINSLYTWAGKHGIDMIGVVSGNLDEITQWKDLSLAAYPLYTAEDTEIKMVVRGNPAVVYLKDGHIIWKTTLRALGTEDFLAPDASGNAESYARDDKALLYNITTIYVIIMLLLLALSFIPDLGRFFPRKAINRDDKVNREELKSHDTPVQ